MIVDHGRELAEAEGFEPPSGFPPLAFKASAFGRSATLPPRTVPAAARRQARPARSPYGHDPDTTRRVVHAGLRVGSPGRQSHTVHRPPTDEDGRGDHAGQQEARMRFDENADLDTSRIDDMRGGGGGGA